MCIVGLVGCGNTKAAQTPEISVTSEQPEEQVAGDNMQQAKLKIIVGEKVLTATLEENATTKALIEKLPLTLKMENLYGREMCYRFGAGTLPVENQRSDRYEVGDIVYWAPRGSFVILYKQNGEEFERQQIGHIASGVEIFEHLGDVDVRFEIER